MPHLQKEIEDISIHAPREGSDTVGAISCKIIMYFYPRSPRGERRRPPSAPGCRKNFYPRSPRGERRPRAAPPTTSTDFYPRSPRGERRRRGARWPGKPDFYPRSPRGERHPHFGGQHPGNLISIHAPREGSDAGGRRTQRRPHDHFYPRSPRGERRLYAPPAKGDRGYFYPRSPRGERRVFTTSFAAPDRFLSTLPARGATGDGGRSAAP